MKTQENNSKKERKLRVSSIYYIVQYLKMTYKNHLNFKLILSFFHQHY